MRHCLVNPTPANKPKLPPPLLLFLHIILDCGVVEQVLFDLTNFIQASQTIRHPLPCLYTSAFRSSKVGNDAVCGLIPVQQAIACLGLMNIWSTIYTIKLLRCYTFHAA
jgi:hypothetical protein